MSSSYSTWFRKGIDPGTVITVYQPVSPRWKILEKLNEHDFQVYKGEHDDYGLRSSASVRILFCDPKRRSKKAFMTGTQDRSGLVPGEFITWLVREIVPGLRLGDRNGAGPFWGLESYEREQVRAVLNEALPKLVENCWYPSVTRARSLVWHRETQTLYFVGRFSKAGKPKRPVVLDAEGMATWELAKPDPADRWKHDDWDGDTSRWEW